MWTRRLSDLAFVACVAVAVVAADGGAEAQTATAQQDPLAPYRERFKRGMDRYKAGAVAEAIAEWEPIYRELGDEKGYRLAYDLGVAYAQIGDVTHAAERLRTFVDQVAVRRARGEVLPPIVVGEEADARARLQALRGASEPADAGPEAGAPPPAGTETPGRPVGSAPAPSATAGAAPSPPATAPVPPYPPPESPPVPARAPVAVTVHPFSPVLVSASAGLTVAATIAAIVLESHASTLHDRFVAEQRSTGTIPQSDRDSFDHARTQAYAAVGGAVGLGAATAALVAWYVLGARRERSVSPTVSLEPSGAGVGLRARF